MEELPPRETRKRIDNINKMTSKETEVFINCYINSFIGFAEDADRLGSDLLKRLVYLSLIDGLSFVPSKIENINDGSKVRFLRFLARFSDWDYWEYVSIPYLYSKLTNKGKLGLKSTEEEKRVQSALIQGVSNSIKDMDSDRIYAPQDVDQNVRFFYGLIEAKGIDITDEIKSKLGNYTFKTIVYELRCSLVHELTESRYTSTSLVGKEAPYYFYEPLDYGTARFWRLGVPSEFVKSVFCKCLLKVREYLIINGENPYRFYDSFFSASF